MARFDISTKPEINTETIWQKWRDNLYGFIFKKTKDPVATEDILQEVFVKIHLKLQQLQSSDRLEAWVFQIARNQVIDYFKGRQKEKDLLQSKEEIIYIFEGEQEEWLCCFDPFLQSLPDKYRIVIQLIHQEGKKQREVADILGISLANVKSRIYRSKEMLKERFMECCKFTLNPDGKLVGEMTCDNCKSYT